MFVTIRANCEGSQPARISCAVSEKESTGRSNSLLAVKVLGRSLYSGALLVAVSRLRPELSCRVRIAEDGVSEPQEVFLLLVFITS